MIECLVKMVLLLRLAGGARLQLGQLLVPHQLVERLAHKVQHLRDQQRSGKEHDAQRQIEHLQNGIHPGARIRLNNVNPHQIGGAEKGQRNYADASRGISTECGEQLDDNEDHDVGVHDVVHPTVEKNN